MGIRTIAMVACLLAAPILSAGQSGAVPPFPRGRWDAVELAGTAVPEIPAARRPHLVFNDGNGLTGSDGCNRVTGSYTVDGESLTVGPVITTQMACNDTVDLQRRFRGALRGTSHWRLAGEHLEFYGATGKPLAVFERPATSPLR